MLDAPGVLSRRSRRPAPALRDAPPRRMISVVPAEASQPPIAGERPPVQTTPPFRFHGGDLVFLLLPWLAALLLGVVLAQRVTTTGPATMSASRAAFFVLNAASLTGF